MSSNQIEVSKKSPVKAPASSSFASKVEESKDVAKHPKKETHKKPSFAPKERRNNVIIVRENNRFKTLVILSKNMLKSQFNSIELHGVDEQSYLTVSLVT